MRVRIRLDVRKPIKRKKKIVKKNGQEITVNCKYERLGEFCFVCGLVTHTDRFCRTSLDRGEEGLMKECGSWLRAPPRKVAGQQQSKWLRDEEDDTWETRIGGESFAGEFFLNNSKVINIKSDSRLVVSNNICDGSKTVGDSNVANFKGYSPTSNILYELNEEVSENIQIKDRKRRRGVPNGLGLMEFELGQSSKVIQTNQSTGAAAISTDDLSGAIQNIPAELAMQANHPQ